MTDFGALRSPLPFLKSQLQDVLNLDLLEAEELWWKHEGIPISDAIDRAGTPLAAHVRPLRKTRRRNSLSARIPNHVAPRLPLRCRLARSRKKNPLLPTYLLMHTISFHDPGICCPYTVSLGTAVPLAKYGSAELQSRFLPHLTRKDDSVWQGATWMTEIKGGSDLGAAVETVASPRERWLASNRRRQILHQQRQRRVSRSRRAPRRERRRRRPRAGPLPRPASQQKWRSQLLHPPPQRQNRHPLRPHRRNRAPR